MELIDITGKRYGKLLVIKQAEKKNGKPTWQCKCDCGNEIIVIGDNLRSGHTLSCGCYKSEQSRKSHTKHGCYGDRLYKVWKNMIQRCRDDNLPTYKLYGGRGISVCNEWKDFIVFKRWAESTGYDYTAIRGACTIDRIDVNGNYESANCRWISQKKQSMNTRTNCRITHNGETRTLTEWAEFYGLEISVLWARINTLNWTFEKAISTPLRKKV